MSRFKLTSKEFLFPFIMITSLFFLWGLAHGMVDTLNKHFQEILSLKKWQSGMVQFALYGAYFVMALPAGFFMQKFGYRKGIVLGLSLFATGAFLISGTALFESFWIFLLCLFIIGCGLATLETAANPYTTRLGPADSAEQRINFSQSFNGLAWVIGPLAALFIYGNQSNAEGEKFSSTVLPMLIIGTIVTIVAVIFSRLKLPEIIEEKTSKNENSSGSALIKKKHFVLGVIAQFCYVAAQTGVFSFLINFVTDEGQTPQFALSNAPYFLSIGFALFMTGRLTGSWLMSYIQPAKLLAVYSALAVVLLFLVSVNLPWISMLALYGVFFVMSIMFPTIFALGIKDLGYQTKKASSFMVMAVVGGALFPPFMGYIADAQGMPAGFLAPLPLFAFIFYYALKGHKIAG